MSSQSLQFATDIINRIQNNLVDAANLTMEQRRICVRFLIHDRKLTQLEIAELLKVSRQTIWEDRKAIDSEEFGASLMIDEIAFIRDLISSGEIAIARLFRKGKEKEAFEVQDKLIDRLQSLGYIKRVPQEHNFTGQISLLEVLGIAPSNPSLSTNEFQRFSPSADEGLLGSDQTGSDPGN